MPRPKSKKSETKSLMSDASKRRVRFANPMDSKVSDGRDEYSSVGEKKPVSRIKKVFEKAKKTVSSDTSSEAEGSSSASRPSLKKKHHKKSEKLSPSQHSFQDQVKRSPSPESHATHSAHRKASSNEGRKPHNYQTLSAPYDKPLKEDVASRRVTKPGCRCIWCMQNVPSLHGGFNRPLFQSVFSSGEGDPMSLMDLHCSQHRNQDCSHTRSKKPGRFAIPRTDNYRDSRVWSEGWPRDEPNEDFYHGAFPFRQQSSSEQVKRTHRRLKRVAPDTFPFSNLKSF